MTQSSRSRAYPALPLRDAIEVLHKLVQKLGRGARDRNAIAQALDYASGASGAAVRRIASLVHYGLLQREKGLYRPTGLADSILSEPDDEKLKEALRQSFLHPALFLEIVDGCLEEGRIPRLLAQSLSAYRIASNARGEVARLFMDSGQFARVFDAHGVFEQDFLASLRHPSSPTSASGKEPANDERTATSPVAEIADQDQVLCFSLTDGKRAEIRVPARLNDQDLAILRIQLNVLETQVQVNKPAPPLRWPSRPDRGSRQG